VTSHPVPYTAATMQEWSRRAEHGVTVAYATSGGATVAFDPGFSSWYEWNPDVVSGYRWVSLGGSSATVGRRPSFLAAVRVARMIRRNHFDLVICHGYRTALYATALIVAKASGARIAVGTDAHRSGSKSARRALIVRIKRRLIPMAYGRLDAVLTASRRGALYHTDDLRLPPERVHLVRNAIDVDFFHRPRADVSRIREHLGVNPGEIIVLFCGKLVEWKRPTDVVEAIVGVPSVRLVFAGSGNEEAKLKATARALNVDRQTVFLGFLDQEKLAGVYQAADILVLPSAYEPFGQVVSEAFAAGTTAIVSDACGAADELVVSGVNGIVYTCGDVVALKEAIETLSDESVRARLSTQAQIDVEDWSVAASGRDFDTLMRHFDIDPAERFA